MATAFATPCRWRTEDLKATLAGQRKPPRAPVIESAGPIQYGGRVGIGADEWIRTADLFAGIRDAIPSVRTFGLRTRAESAVEDDHERHGPGAT